MLVKYGDRTSEPMQKGFILFFFFLVHLTKKSVWFNRCKNMFKTWGLKLMHLNRNWEPVRLSVTYVGEAKRLVVH